MGGFADSLRGLAHKCYLGGRGIRKREGLSEHPKFPISDHKKCNYLKINTD